jgi:phosphoglycerate kinase
MKSIKDQSLSKIELKNVLLRLDLNVPLDNGKIIDDTRIHNIVDTIIFLLRNNAKIVIISHVGRPKGRIDKKLSLKPIAKRLEYILKTSPDTELLWGSGQNVRLLNDNLKEITKENIFINKNEKIVMLENIRFYEEEEKNDNNFAKKLSSLGDIYVNDAFSCSHRSHASIEKITNYLPSFSGFQLDEEISALKKITSEIKKPITCIIGGSKISTKINIIKNLVPKFDNIIIVGGMANNILKFRGYPIGKSIREENSETIVNEIFKAAKKHGCCLTFPEDVAVGKNKEDSRKIKEINEIKEDDLILDIGPKTINKIKKIIENSKTVLWNGPAGYFENPNFRKGSLEIAKKIKEKNEDNSFYSVAGGGDTIAVLNLTKTLRYFNFSSTAGGAFLEYLEGKELPGIKALN